MSSIPSTTRARRGPDHEPGGWPSGGTGAGTRSSDGAPAGTNPLPSTSASNPAIREQEHPGPSCPDQGKPREGVMPFVADLAPLEEASLGETTYATQGRGGGSEEGIRS